MPNRIIRERARSSPTLDAVSAEAERLFWRLTVTADDHGRFDADPRVVLASCFPLRFGRWKPATVRPWMRELVKAGAIQLYEAGGRRYGFFPTWSAHQRRPQGVSKYPAPPDHGDPTVTPPCPDGDHTVITRSRSREVENREVVNGGAPTMVPPEQRARNIREIAAMRVKLAEKVTLPADVRGAGHVRP